MRRVVWTGWRVLLLMIGCSCRVSEFGMVSFLGLVFRRMCVGANGRRDGAGTCLSHATRERIISR